MANDLPIPPHLNMLDAIHVRAYLEQLRDSAIKLSTTSNITASTTQSQGQGVLSSQLNEVATVANTNDTVTLPPAAIGIKCIIINNGANTLQIFPNTDDDLGSGVDASTTLASGSNVQFIAYDTINWEII